MLRLELELFHRALPHFLLIVHIHQHFYELTKHIHTGNLTFHAVRQRYDIADTRQLAVQVFIGFLLVFQATHQSSADTRNLRRVQGQVLLFCHLDRNRCKLGQIRMAAKRSAADANSAEDLCLIADTDLAKLDSRLKDSRQILYQLTEINSSVGGKVKQHLVIVKRILCIDQLHLQVVRPDLLLADFKRFFFFLAVALLPRIILRRCNADDFFQRLDHFGIVNFFWPQHNETILYAARRLNDNVVAHADVQLSRREIIYFSYVSKTYSYNCYHVISFPSLSGT